MKNNKKVQTLEKHKLLSFLIPLVATAVVYLIKKHINNQTNSNNHLNKTSDSYPMCDCGTPMTIYDGCWWYTCPSCGNKKKITNTKEQWYEEIFKLGNKEMKSDFELADLCRGGDLFEE